MLEAGPGRAFDVERKHAGRMRRPRERYSDARHLRHVRSFGIIPCLLSFCASTVLFRLCESVSDVATNQRSDECPDLQDPVEIACTRDQE